MTETATDAEGNQTVTETKTETAEETAVTTTENADGTVTTKTETVSTEKVTETVTDAEGKVTETVRETVTETVKEITADADGTETGTVRTTETVKDENGSVLSAAVTEAEIKAATDENGVKTTETAATVTKTDADGNETVEKTVTTENLTADGSTGTTVTDENGRLLSQETVISAAEAEAARDEGRPMRSPLTVAPAPGGDAEHAVPVRIDLPAINCDKDGDGRVSRAEMPKVELSVTYTGPGVIAMIRGLLDRWLPVKTCYEGSLIVPVSGDCEICVVDNTKTFDDVAEGQWFNEYVGFVAARGIFNGDGNGRFLPQSSMTRGMVAQVLYNFDLGAKPGDGTVFNDVTATAWYSGAVGWAKESGVAQGYGESFGAEDDVLRQDLAVILYNYAKTAGYDVSATAELDSFPDAGEVADYAVDAMRWAVGSGLIVGMDDGTLAPRGTTTRAQVATVMTRFVRNG